MKSLRLLAILVLLAASLSATSAEASSATVHELGGNNSFTATRTSKTLVRFTASIPFEDVRMSFDGDGRVYGFRMQKTGDFANGAGRPTMTNITVGRCTKRACQARTRIGTPTFGNNLGPDLSGTWELYVIADGAPVTVTIKLKGLDGSSTVDVSDRVTSQVETLTPTIHEDNSKNVYSAGSFSPIPQADLGFVGMWFSADTYAASSFGDCAYDEGNVNQPPEEIAFLPGCPTGDGFEFFDVEENPRRGSWQLTSIRDYCCTSGIGAWYASATTVEHSGAVALYIDI